MARRSRCQICTADGSKAPSDTGCSVPQYFSLKPLRSNVEAPCTVEKPQENTEAEGKENKKSACYTVSHTSPPTSASDKTPPGDDIPLLRPLASLNWPCRDDPKSLQTTQYEAIAHPNLPALLTSIDKLRGPEREDTLQRALGVTAPELHRIAATSSLAEAVEAAARGGKDDALGLDWGE
ncbi:hypothetical protein C8R43DRAFT_1017348 [Mycena crocata]|nr:hypothetical protein C8R43DRAFT_1017348 [Mycena crocata]